MRREIVGVLPEPAEIDDLPCAGARGGVRDGGRGCTIEGLEVAAAERVHEVVDDVRAVERAADRSGIGGVGGDPLDPVLFCRRGRSRHADDVVVARECLGERTPDGAGGSDDCNAHGRTLRPIRPNL